MAIDVPTFRIRYPEFETKVTDPVIQVYLDDSQCDLSPSRFSNSSCGVNIYERMIFLLTAHYCQLYVNRQSGSVVSGGVISNKSVGKVSVGYAVEAPKGSNGWFKQTTFGDEYLMMLRKYLPAVLTVKSCGTGS